LKVRIMSGTGTGARPTIFISHAASDKKAVDLLVDWVSGITSGVADVFCTSSPGYDIPAGAGFFQHIEVLLDRSSLVIHFVSPAFLSSDFCMLELGAAWAQRKSFLLLAPPLTVKDMNNTALSSLQLVTLASGDGLDKLRDRLSDLLGLSARIAGWIERRDRVIGSIYEALGKPAGPPITRMTSVGVREHHLEAWALHTDGQISHSWWPNDNGASTWNKPHNFSTPGRIADLAAASRGPGHCETFAVDDRGTLWHRWWSPSGWSGWDEFPGQRIAPPLSACSLRDGHIEVFALDPTTHAVIHTWSDEPHSWHDWIPLDEGLERQ
jgi:hypothetical protein